MTVDSRCLSDVSQEATILVDIIALAVGQQYMYLYFMETPPKNVTHTLQTASTVLTGLLKDLGYNYGEMSNICER